MDFSIVRTTEEMQTLEAEWNAILDQMPVHAPFLRHEYQLIWWRHCGGGEWPGAELSLVTARQDGRLVGVAPLFQADNPEGEPALLLIGSIEISDYLDLITAPENLFAFLDGLLDFLAKADLPEWKLLDWFNILEESPTLKALEAAAQKQAWTYAAERIEHSPYVPLPGDWETYLAGLDKKQRHEIRRKMRRAAESIDPMHWYIVNHADSLEVEANAFLELMAHDPEKARFLTPPMREQMHEIIHCAFEEGCLQLAFLEFGGKKAAGYLNFDYLNRIWVYNSGLDPSKGGSSPGWVLLGHLVQWAIENHREVFDFLRGNEDYKYRFGGQDRFVMRARVRRK